MRLSPYHSAGFAKNIYALTEIDTIDTALIYLNSRYDGRVLFSEETMLGGMTGGPGIIKVKTAFGFVLFGHKEFENNIFIVFRGTKYLADWLTNFNVSTSRTCSSQLIHDGFNQSFKSMKPKIQKSLSNIDRGVSIHCIGHSLGGALATITADWLATEMGFKPHLYTFGSPKVGLEGFAKSCTNTLGDRFIYRVYHSTDIVPYIPVWPFVHTPFSNKDFYIWSPGKRPWATWHSMDRYLSSVRDYGWQRLGSMQPMAKNDSSIDNWLRNSRVYSACLDTLGWITDSLYYVLKKSSAVLGNIVDFMSSGVLTSLDKLALLLEKAIGSDNLVSELLFYLLNKIAQFLGWREGIKKENITREKIRLYFEALSIRANEICKKALSEVMVDGRAL